MSEQHNHNSEVHEMNKHHYHHLTDIKEDGQIQQPSSPARTRSHSIVDWFHNKMSEVKSHHMHHKHKPSDTGGRTRSSSVSDHDMNDSSKASPPISHPSDDYRRSRSQTVSSVTSNSKKVRPPKIQIRDTDELAYQQSSSAHIFF